MGIKIKGHNELTSSLRRLPKQFLDASAVGQFNAAQDIMALSRTRVPFEEGKIDAGAFVSDPTFGAKSANVEFGYYGPQYIERQHEDLTLSHPGADSKNPSMGAQGQPKFLESAVDEMAMTETRDTIAEAVRVFVTTGMLPQARGDIGDKQ